MPAGKNTDHQFKEGHFKQAVRSYEQVPSQTQAAFDELLASLYSFFFFNPPVASLKIRNISSFIVLKSGCPTKHCVQE